MFIRPAYLYGRISEGYLPTDLLPGKTFRDRSKYASLLPPLLSSDRGWHLQWLTTLGAKHNCPSCSELRHYGVTGECSISITLAIHCSESHSTSESVTNWLWMKMFNLPGEPCCSGYLLQNSKTWRLCTMCYHPLSV